MPIVGVLGLLGLIGASLGIYSLNYEENRKKLNEELDVLKRGLSNENK